MATRFSDDLSHNTDDSDFVVRRRLPLALQIALIFAVAFMAILATASIMCHTGDITLFLVTLLFTFGSLTWCCILYSSRLRDLVMATEFQNAMLASAAQLSTRFCMITKRDGHIVYIDSGFQEHFPYFLQGNERNIEGLLEGVGVPHDLIQKVWNLFEQSQNGRVLLPLITDKGESLSIMMSVEVLPRPKGYFLLRGRDFVEKRTSGDPPQKTAGAPPPPADAKKGN